MNNVFMYGLDCKVFFCAVNFLESLSDDTVIAQFMPFIKEWIGDYKIVVDQGFPRRASAHGIYVGPVSKHTAHWLEGHAHDYLLKISNMCTSLRQAS